ncbi:putative ubiquitin family domain-containing protein [Neospora caninum Liverpool]|uniref:Putative ubiquitin family domain-containing protein n=1 Tax=Neospora caninum (strain Liverpool) TaxID=572307 RepID=F0VCY7_NEOCL|nr:putative ubiquitin family domain-containing protein [Neospora caninum Liverpool]CBZ51502.1 putative ubiquitin family domain-containing protein [Neospora caninum Liverpool]|eukprot:XP_003881535.1 putative ubiquitin family domain-containing protein [Neospora caninum Liverpool]
MEPSFSPSDLSASAPPGGSASPPSDDILEVNFRCIDGRTFSLELPTDIDIADVISLVADEVDWPSSRVRLIYHGRSLTTGTTLQSCDVKSGHTIHVVRQQAPAQPGPENSPSSAASLGGEAHASQGSSSLGAGLRAVVGGGVTGPPGASAGVLGAGALPGMVHGTGTAGTSAPTPMWTPISLPGGGTMMVGHMQFPAHMAVNVAPQQSASQRGSGSVPASGPVASSDSRGSLDRHAAAGDDTGGVQAASDGSGRRGSAFSASGTTRPGASRALALGGEGVMEERGGAASGAARDSPFASPLPHAVPRGSGSLFSATLRGDEASGAEARPSASSGTRSSARVAREDTAAPGLDERSPQPALYGALAGALESAAHRLLRAADQVRREARSHGVGLPAEESASPRASSPTPAPNRQSSRPEEQGADSTVSPRPTGERAEAQATPRGRTGETETVTRPALQTPLLQLNQQPTVILPGGLTAHVLPVAVHVSVDPRSRSEEGSDTSVLGTARGSSDGQTPEGLGGPAIVGMEAEGRPSRSTRPRELMITHEFVQRLLPWPELRETLEVIHRERGWAPGDLPRVSTQTGAPPPLSIFLPSFVSALNLVAAMLQQFMGWQQGVAQMSVPTVGRSALALARLSATTAGLSALLTSIFNSMARHVDQNELAEAMSSDASPVEVGQERRSPGHPAPSRSGQSPVPSLETAQGRRSSPFVPPAYASGREDSRTLLAPLHAGEASRGHGSGDRRRRESESEESESRGRRRVETGTVGGLGLSVMCMRDGGEKEDREREEDLDAGSARQQRAEEEAAAFAEGSSLPVSPSSSRASPRASAPSVVSLTSSNAATAGSSSSSTEARDALLAAVTAAGASLNSFGASPQGASSLGQSPTSNSRSAQPGLIALASDRRKDDGDSFPSSASLFAEPDDPSSGEGREAAAHGREVGRDAVSAGREGVEDDLGRRGVQGQTLPGGRDRPAGSLQNLLFSLGGAQTLDVRQGTQETRGAGGFGVRGGPEGRDTTEEDEAIDEEVRTRLQMWTGNAQQFSRNVLAYARPHPFSSAYRSGDVTQSSSVRTPVGEAVENVLSLSWHRALNRVNVGDEPRPPASLAPGYLALLMREAATSARNNNDFAMQQERFPHIRLALQLLQDAEQPGI